jgi:hypothetical protein
MPERHAAVFSMGEVMGISTEEICKQLEISTSHLHVILYRARSSLQSRIKKSWFGADHGKVDVFMRADLEVVVAGDGRAAGASEALVVETVLDDVQRMHQFFAPDQLSLQCVTNSSRGTREGRKLSRAAARRSLG